MTLNHLRSRCPRARRHISCFDALIYTLVLIYFVHVSIAYYWLSKAYWRGPSLFFMGRRDTDMWKPDPGLLCHVLKHWHWPLQGMSGNPDGLGTQILEKWICVIMKRNRQELDGWIRQGSSTSVGGAQRMRRYCVQLHQDLQHSTAQHLTSVFLMYLCRCQTAKISR